MQSEQMKRGIVVDGRGSQVRVRFEDNDQVISGWLDVVQRSSAGMRVFTRPKPGSQVVCAMDGNREAGVVLGALYSDADPAPTGGDGTMHFEMPDGSTAIWDGDAFTIDHSSGLVLTIAGGKLVVDGDLEITRNVMVSGDLVVSGDTTLKDTSINGIGQVSD
ncbi:phage baseplate assembly protein V [Ruegeria sp. ANG-R]|uniref:phage baseplate assembly protein V n=1 Tax=Ruegeria sp. ANG-R TaxID=1577903 RepID=UPI00068D577F|nr:phage baseplate assembly protein V [Ruegeria sp. ANG-R]